MRTAYRSRRSIPPRSAFAGFRFPSDVIVLAVRWYLRFGLSYRDVEEPLAERGVEVDHVTVYRWVHRFTPLAVVKIGSGIGCGLFINNELERGNSGLAGELGHIPSEPEGQRCSCGNRGCLQTVAGSDAIVGALQQAGRTDVQDIAAAAGLVHGGDHTAREVFQRAGEALGRGLAMLLNLLNLEAIGLCGEPAILSSGVYLDTVRDTLGRRAYSTAADDCDLWIEERTDELEARGAASMVFDHLVDLREPATDA